MPDQPEQVLPYILIVAGVGILGGVSAAFWAPGVVARSAVQHFAAGAVIAAVAGEIVPEVKRRRSGGYSQRLRSRWINDDRTKVVSPKI